MEEIKNEVPVAEAPVVEAPQEKKETKAPAARMNASVAPEDFDWDAFEGGDAYGATDKKAIEDAYSATLSKVVENEVVEGEVTAVNKREVVVTIGGKSEGVIPVSEGGSVCRVRRGQEGSAGALPPQGPYPQVLG